MLIIVTCTVLLDKSDYGSLKEIINGMELGYNESACSEFEDFLIKFLCL